MTRLSLESARGLMPPGPWDVKDGAVYDSAGQVICRCDNVLFARVLAFVPEMLEPPRFETTETIEVEQRVPRRIKR